MYTHLKRVQYGILPVAMLLLFCGTAAAQTIAGVVSDTSGGVLPGVTVEARSAAQNQPARTVVTDEAGRYRIVNLQPGTYTVTFTLVGFTAAARPGITLTTDFTATIDMQLTLGAQTETITVTAESPLVDVQSSAAPQTVTREILDTIPTSRSAEAVGVLIPGVTLRASGNGQISRDVGGSTMMNQSTLQYRGTNDSVQVLTGLRRVFLRPGPEFNGVVYPNDAAVEEMTFGQGAEALDMGQSGMRINIVPKSGGNVYHGVLFGSYARDSFQSEMNIDDQLRALNFTNRIGLVKMWDFNPSLNGPIVRDKLWFSAAYRNWGVTNTAPITFNEATDRQSYRPGMTSATEPGDIWDVTARIGWQASRADNVSFLVQEQTKFRPRFGISSLTSPEATSINQFPTHTYQGRWTRVQSANLLFDAAYQYFEMQNQTKPQDATLREVWCYDNIRTPKTAPPAFFQINEQTLGINYNGSAACGNDFTNNHHYLGTATLIKGAHEMKAGISFLSGESYNPASPVGYASYTYRNGAPLQATLRLPTARVDKLKADLGLYAQDRWRLDRLTLTYGIRLDLLRTGWPEQSLPTNPYIPETTFAARDTFVNWKDLSPRVGFAYDLFGAGRTALKGNLSRYVAAETLNLTGIGNPMGGLSTTVNRAWTDLNGDRTIFNPNFTLQEAELGPSQNLNFGRVVQNTRVDEALLEGWGHRPYTYEFDLGVQHQIAPRASATAVFYRRWSGNQLAMVNEAVRNSDYSAPFCITAPSDSRLPNGGGYQVCGLYDINPSALGRTSNVIVPADTLGTGVGAHRNTGLNLTANVRMADVLVQGGIDLRRDELNVCGIDAGDRPAGITFPIGGGAGIAAAVASPENIVFSDGSTTCDTDTGFRPDIKFSGSYQLPWGIQTSATYQNASGPSITANWPVPNSTIAAALGRNLSAGATQTKTVSLIQPDTVFGDRLNQIDVRFSKRFSVGRTARLLVNADLYNVTNSNWIIGYTNAYGPNFMRPTQVLSPRLFKIGGQFDF
jgi:hypothetical protein